MRNIINKEKNFSYYFMIFTLIIIATISLVFLISSNLLLFLISFVLVLFISFKLKINKFPLLLFLISFLIRLIGIYILDFPQVTDFEVLLDAAKKFSIGDFSFQNIKYFSLWGYQTGFVIYEGVLLKIFKKVVVLKIFNALYSSLLVLFIYIFGKKISSEKSARLSSILYMIFPFPLYLNSVLANHHISAFLMYLGIMFLLREKKNIKDYVIAAILISFGNIMRPEGIIVIVSLILFELFKVKKNEIFDIGKKLLIFILVYYLIGVSSSLVVQKTGINKAGLTNKDPKWKFVLGFNHEKCGYYNREDEQKYLNNNSEEIKVIKERILSNPLKTTELFICKIDNFWLQSNISVKSDMYKNKVYNLAGFNIKFNDLQKIVISFNHYLYIITFIMCLFGIVYKRKKIIDNNSYFFVIMMIVTFGIYLLIEIQPRYTYFIHISIFILSTYGYDYLIDKLSNNKYFKIK